MGEHSIQTNTAVGNAYLEVMERTGFYRNGKPTIGVFEATTLRERDDELNKRIKYSAVIDSTKLDATAIFELSGSPCIYFSCLSQANPDAVELAQLRKIAWNQGMAPLLWVITPTQVFLYNSYAKPTSDDEKDVQKHLVGLFEYTEQSLRRLNEFAGRLQFESGDFWKHEKAIQIARRQRVDESLLDDLEAAEQLLTQAHLEPLVAHALLGRSIFVAYLQDRGILDASFFQERFHVGNFADLLRSEHPVSDIYQVFKWLRETFNGDLFPLDHKNEQGNSIHEQDLVEKKHLKAVGNFLAGVEMKSGQGRLWPYKFDIIPVELISSIYEKFIHASDVELAIDRSTYYTPINLVDLVLSEVEKSLPVHANVLDMSCGSGIFLVEALRRLVAHRIAHGERWSRALVRDTLYNQIYGVDINGEAVQIAAFSLYLTALELDPDPQSLQDVRFEILRERNLFTADAFDENASFNVAEPFISKSFHAIVGNPPWRRKDTHILADDYCKKYLYPVTRRSLDQAFLWRIANLVNHKTLIGLILHSTPLFSHTEESLQARKGLFTRLTPKVIVNLSELRQDDLFPKKDAPAMALIAKGCPLAGDKSFYFVNVEHSEAFKRHGILEIGPENVKKISIQHLLSDTDVLKIASWGNAHDMALIMRLRSIFPPLRMFVQEPKTVKMRSEEWLGGQGYQKSGTKSAPMLIGKKQLASGEMSRYVVDSTYLKEISSEQRYHRARDSRIYEAPLVITTRGLKREGFFSAFASIDVVYTEEYYGISFPPQKESAAHYINGLLNSSLASYFLFLTASVWGIERDKVEPNDLLRFPIPPFSQENEHIRRILELETTLCLSQDQTTRDNAKVQLDSAVFDLYDLSEIERVLVEDTINFTIALRMRGGASQALERPGLTELETYCHQFIQVLQPFFQTLREVTMDAEIFEIRKAPLQVIKFSLVPIAHNASPIRVTQGQALEDVLEKIALELPAKLADTVYTRRNLRISTENAFFIVKLSQRRQWSRRAAVEDVDAIIAEQLKGNYAAIR